MLPVRPAICLVVVTSAAALAALAAGPAAADDDDDDASKLYAGVGLGVTDFSGDHEGITYSDTPVGWQLYGGYQAREGAAVELAVERLAGIESGDILGSGVDRLRISAEHSSLTVRGVFNLSLEEVLRGRPKITVFGTVGLARLLEKRSVTELVTSRSTSVSERDTGLALSAGVTFEIAGVRIRTYLQSVDRADGDLNSVGAAAEFRF
jgi:outer membrane protein with beta-barrel domain